MANLVPAFLFPILLPIGTTAHRYRTAVTTCILIALISLGYLAGMIFPDGMVDLFALHKGGPLYQFVTYAFLHKNVFHLLVNAYFFWVFGAALEEKIGSLRLLALFVLCAFVGALAHQLYTRGGTTDALVGASAAVYGTIGAYIIVLPYSKIRCWFCLIVLVVPLMMRTFNVIAFLFLPLYWLLDCVFRLSAMSFLEIAPNVASSTPAHMGGLGAGMLFATALYGFKAFAPSDDDCGWHRDRKLHSLLAGELRKNWIPPSAQGSAKPIDWADDTAEGSKELMPLLRLIVQRRIQEASVAYAEALEKDPEACLPPGPQMNMIRQLIGVGEYDLAIRALEILLAKHQDEEITATARYELAHLFLRLGRYPDRAAEMLQKFLDSNPPENLEKQARALLDQLPAPRPADQQRTPVFEIHEPGPTVVVRPHAAVIQDELMTQSDPGLHPDDIPDSFEMHSSSEILRKADDLFGDPSATDANVPMVNLIKDAPVKVSPPRKLEDSGITPIRFKTEGGVGGFQPGTLGEDSSEESDSGIEIKFDDSDWIAEHGMQAPSGEEAKAHPSMIVPPSAPRNLEEPERPKVEEGIWLTRKAVAKEETPSLVSHKEPKAEAKPVESPREIKIEGLEIKLDLLQKTDEPSTESVRLESVKDPVKPLIREIKLDLSSNKVDLNPTKGEEKPAPKRPTETEPSAPQPKREEKREEKKEEKKKDEKKEAPREARKPASFIAPTGVPFAPDQTTPAAFHSALADAPSNRERAKAMRDDRRKEPPPSRKYALLLAPGADVDLTSVIFLMGQELGLSTDAMHHALLRRRGILAEDMDPVHARALADQFVRLGQSIVIAAQDPVAEFGSAVDLHSILDMGETVRVATELGAEVLRWENGVCLGGGWVGLAPGTPCRAVVDLYFRNPHRHLRIWENTFIYAASGDTDRRAKFQTLVHFLLGRTRQAIQTRTLNTWISGDVHDQVTTQFTSLIEYENFLRWHLLVFCVPSQRVEPAR